MSKMFTVLLNILLKLAENILKALRDTKITYKKNQTNKKLVTLRTSGLYGYEMRIILYNPHPLIRSPKF